MPSTSQLTLLDFYDDVNVYELLLRYLFIFIMYFYCRLYLVLACIFINMLLLFIFSAHFSLYILYINCTF